MSRTKGHRGCKRDCAVCAPAAQERLRARDTKAEESFKAGLDDICLANGDCWNCGSPNPNCLCGVCAVQFCGCCDCLAYDEEEEVMFGPLRLYQCPKCGTFRQHTADGYQPACFNEINESKDVYMVPVCDETTLAVWRLAGIEGVKDFALRKDGLR